MLNPLAMTASLVTPVRIVHVVPLFLRLDSSDQDSSDDFEDDCVVIHTSMLNQDGLVVAKVYVSPDGVIRLSCTPKRNGPQWKSPNEVKGYRARRGVRLHQKSKE